MVTLFLVLISFIVLICSSYGASVTKINLGHQQGYFQGDIEIHPQMVRSGVNKRLMWEDNTIPYELGDSWTSRHLDLLNDAMKEIQDNTCINFIKRTNEKNYISIVNGSTGCSSLVGRSGGKQYVNLLDSPRGTCWAHETIVHELLHSVGLLHEQMRPDRDDYIYVFIENVDEDKRDNFSPCNSDKCNNSYGIPYNYLSVMHYDKTAFSDNQKITMLPKDTIFSDALGQAKTGHPFDYEIVRRMYQCPNTTVTCYSCETTSKDINCQSGTCTGNVCYTLMLPNGITKGCGDYMHTLIGSRNGAQVGGCSMTWGCKSDLCNKDLPAVNIPHCNLAIPCNQNNIMITSGLLIVTRLMLYVTSF